MTFTFFRTNRLVRRNVGFCALAAVLLAVGGTAQAAIVYASESVNITVDNVEYEVSYVWGENNPGASDDVSDIVQAQPWFGDQTLAGDFSNAVNMQLGLPYSGSYGPHFAYNLPGVDTGSFNAHYYRFTNVLRHGGFSKNTPLPFAIATVIPEPGSVALLGLGGLCLLGRWRPVATPEPSSLVPLS